MKIRSCNLENFRNVESAQLRFDADRIFFVGLNGQGKSNLLEALGLLHAVRSFRTSDIRALIRMDHPEARLYYHLETAAPDQETVLFRIRRAGGREVELNEEKCASLSEFLSRFPSVVLAMDDVQIIRGSPSIRRRMMDLHFATSRRHYYECLREFTRGLASRNRLLKAHASVEQIRAHDQPLAKVAVDLSDLRKKGTEDLSPIFNRIFQQISSGKDEPGIRLKDSLKASSAEELREAWIRGLDRDRMLGATQVGPHRDDWVFSTSGATAKDFASDGQQRNLAIALKLSLFEDLRSQLSDIPVLLADDVLGELDPRRREAFWKNIPDGCQIFSTGTEFDPAKHPGDWQVFQVEAGKFTEQSSQKSFHP